MVVGDTACTERNAVIVNLERTPAKCRSPWCIVWVESVRRHGVRTIYEFYDEVRNINE